MPLTLLAPRALRLLSRPRAVLAVTASAGACAGCGVATCEEQLVKKTRREPRQQAAGAPLLPTPAPKLVDAVLAGLGLCGSCATLGWLETAVGIRLFAPPMLASGIIFFHGPSPPQPTSFLSGTLCSATLSLGVLTLLSPLLPPVAAQSAAAGTLLVWYKCTGGVFPPAAVLAGALATASVASGAAQTSAAAATASGSPVKTMASSALRVLRWLAFPWLAGHAGLYACALALSELRTRARVATTKHQARVSLQHQSDAALLETFARFDTNGDRALDADELKVALRTVLGVDIAREDCEQLIAAADKDGTGTVDFGEFKAIARGML